MNKQLLKAADYLEEMEEDDDVKSKRPWEREMLDGWPNDTFSLYTLNAFCTDDTCDGVSALVTTNTPARTIVQRRSLSLNRWRGKEMSLYHTAAIAIGGLFSVISMSGNDGNVSDDMD